MRDKSCGMTPIPSKINLINCIWVNFIASGVVKMGLVASVPGGALKVPCCGVGSSQRAGFHLNFEPEGRSQRLSHGLSWKRTPAKTIDTAGRLGAPLVTSTTGPVFPALRLTLVNPATLLSRRL